MFNIFKKSTVVSLNQSDWHSQFKNDSNAVIIDVRSPQECASGVIPKAKKINFFDPNFKGMVDQLDKNKSYYLYCRSGNRSGKACRIMQSLGFEKTFNLSGGMMGWQGKVA